MKVLRMNQPLFLFCLMGVLIFCFEVLVMFFLDRFRPLGPVAEAFSDALLLVLLLVPTLYFLFLRPLNRQLGQNQRMKDELEKSRSALEKSHQELQELFERVQASHNEWVSTLDCVQDMIVLSEEDGRIRRCNRAFSRFTGLDYPQLLGCRWPDFIEDLSIGSSVEYQGETELCHQSRGRSYLLKTYTYTRLSDKGAPCYVVTMQDITETKIVQMELQQAYDRLRESQGQMLQKEKMASIGQLAAGVAHEINNPVGYVMSNLSSLEGYVRKLSDYLHWQDSRVQQLADAALLAEVAEQKKKIKLEFILGDVADLIRESLEGTRRIRTIVQNLKTFSRVDEAEQQSVNLNECIESTINIVWNEIKYKAELVRELGELPPLECYPQQLSQVFLNLLVNASHAIEGQGTIRVRSWSESDAVHVAISDTGCGISVGTRQKIFEPFYTTKPVGQGTGLGLSIAYEIIKKHRGDIQLQSEPGKGSTFTIHLPLSPEKDDPR